MEHSRTKLILFPFILIEKASSRVDHHGLGQCRTDASAAAPLASAILANGSVLLMSLNAMPMRCAYSTHINVGLNRQPSKLILDPLSAPRPLFMLDSQQRPDVTTHSTTEHTDSVVRNLAWIVCGL